MPPKKSAKQAPSGAAAAATSPFITRLTRQQLERLVQDSVNSGVAPTLASIKALLPVSLRSTEVKKVSVAGGDERQGTGLFDGLDVELLVEILRHTGLKQRLHCATSVCKAWRLLASHQELFSQLELCPNMRWARGYEKLNIAESRLLPFVSWLPKQGAEVERLTLDTGDKHNSLSPDVTKKLLAQLVNLSALELSGKKVTAAVLSVAAKQPWASRLASFSLADAPARTGDALPLLLKASQLVELRLNCGTGDAGIEHNLRSLARGWSDARGGGGAAPLLAKLDLSGWAFMLSWPTLAALGRLFPELEELSLSGVDIGGVDVSCPPLEALPRLRKLHVGRFMRPWGATGHRTTAEVGCALRSLFTLAPSVEELSVAHGKAYVSEKERKMGMRVPPLPGCDGALELLPASVRRLSLSTIVLRDDDKLALAQLPRLRALTLSDCGDYARRMATELCQLSAHLSPSRVILDRVSLAPPLEEGQKAKEVRQYEMGRMNDKEWENYNQQIHGSFPGAAEASTSRCASSGTAPPCAADGDKSLDDMLDEDSG